MPGTRFGRADGGHATVVGVGTTQTGATPIVESTNFLTSETGQTGFILPAKWPAGTPIVCRVGTVAATIFPAVGGKINAGAADAVYSATAGKQVIFFPWADGSEVTNWFAVQGA